MTQRITSLALVLGSTLALPSLVLAQAVTLPSPSLFPAVAGIAPMSAFERSTIDDLDGMMIDFPNFAASGFPALPAGQHYGVKEHTLVVVDTQSGVILHLVQVLSGVNGR